ncbi:hypothetical protein NDU88_004651 [Pleurodeles waltl]|uniref:Uncharacterized protein n=1 Tax=Pleurodeles waltl TaxID=8319 RepID=A0AAV7RGU1_PLEWA|nr:hypothetical protein NDU88_004651 [Pleurodeles waltl]
MGDLARGQGPKRPLKKRMQSQKEGCVLGRKRRERKPPVYWHDEQLATTLPASQERVAVGKINRIMSLIRTNWACISQLKKRTPAGHSRTQMAFRLTRGL